jgi:hypothetical protein
LSILPAIELKLTLFQSSSTLPQVYWDFGHQKTEYIVNLCLLESVHSVSIPSAAVCRIQSRSRSSSDSPFRAQDGAMHGRGSIVPSISATTIRGLRNCSHLVQRQVTRSTPAPILDRFGGFRRQRVGRNAEHDGAEVVRSGRLAPM